jgi:polyhydroxybutyrate depolymerase
VVGVDAWAAFWVRHNEAAADAQITALAPDTTVRTWHGATPASDVVFYRVEHAGHTWPAGRQYLPPFLIGTTTRRFNASEVIWRFCADHARR